MATTIKLKNSVTTTNAPSSLVQGEVAINITDKKVWVGNAATTPIQLLGDGGSGSFTSIAFGAGTVSLPSITFTGDTNTGIFFPAADTIAFTEGGAESMRIDSSGNVGIGTSSPNLFTAENDSKLTVGTGSGNGGITIYTGNTSQGGIFFADGTTGADTYSGILRYNHSSNAMLFYTNGLNERMRIDSSGNVGIGTSSPATRLDVSGTGVITSILSTNNNNVLRLRGNNATNGAWLGTTSSDDFVIANGASITERMRITSGGDVYIARTSDVNTDGFTLAASGFLRSSTTSFVCAVFNRNTTDGELISFRQDGTAEGNISVSGSTVSYNGGHLSRYAQTLTSKDDSLVKGTVLSNLDEMNEYVDAEGNPVPNEQLNKVKVSDVEGDVNVAGVFVNWSFDEQHNVDEINMAMTGDMIIRIAQGVVVQKGDLLMSAGDGTAKPQGDDIVRSKTVAKVTSNHVTCTYEDGSYCVPCVLMAC